MTFVERLSKERAEHELKKMARRQKLIRATRKRNRRRAEKRIR